MNTTTTSAYTKKCNAFFCRRRVKKTLFMCPEHWRMVPEEQQRRIVALWQPSRKRQTDHYYLAAFQAIMLVAAAEGRTEQVEEYARTVERLDEKTQRGPR